MIQLTKDDYNDLKKYEIHLIRGVRGNYVYNMTQCEAEALFTIYNRVYHKNEKAIGCTRCRLNVCKLLGGLYFKYQQDNNIEKPKRNGKKRNKEPQG